MHRRPRRLRRDPDVRADPLGPSPGPEPAQPIGRSSGVYRDGRRVKTAGKIAYVVVWRFRRHALAVRLAGSVLLVVLGSSSAAALDPHKAITQYAHQVWKTDNGLPQNSIQSILQTRDGYLWLGTERGLVRFDGVQFTVFDKGNAPGLQNSNAQALFQDRDGQPLGGDLGRAPPLQGRPLHGRTRRKEGLPNNRVLAICAGPRTARLWIGTGGGIARLEGREDDRVLHVAGRVSPTTASGRSRMDREGSLWIGTDGGGLNRFRDGKFTVFGPAAGVPGRDRAGSSRRQPRRPLDRHRRRRASSATGSGRFTGYTTKEGLSSDTVESIHEDRDGNLWIGNQSGGAVAALRRAAAACSGPPTGSRTTRFSSICEDGEGSLWIGTVAGGLNRLKDGKFTAYSRKEGLSSDRIRTIYEDRAGAIWLGTRGAGVNRFVERPVHLLHREGRPLRRLRPHRLRGRRRQALDRHLGDGLKLGWTDPASGPSTARTGCRARSSAVSIATARARSGSAPTTAASCARADGQFQVYGTGRRAVRRDGARDRRGSRRQPLDRHGGRRPQSLRQRQASRPSRPRTASPTTPSSRSTKTRTAASGSAPTAAASIALKNGKFTRFTRKDGLFDDVQYADPRGRPRAISG